MAVMQRYSIIWEIIQKGSKSIASPKAQNKSIQAKLVPVVEAKRDYSHGYSPLLDFYSSSELEPFNDLVTIIMDTHIYDNPTMCQDLS